MPNPSTATGIQKWLSVRIALRIGGLIAQPLSQKLDKARGLA